MCQTPNLFFKVIIIINIKKKLDFDLESQPENTVDHVVGMRVESKTQGHGKWHAVGTFKTPKHTPR